MPTPISFGFASASTYGNRLDLTARVDKTAINGFEVLTNGMDPNQKIEPEFGMTDLIPRAPRDEVYPAITSTPGNLGKIFGNNIKWRVRYRNSKTGETTGLSPLPFMGYNLGRETYTGSGSHLGQTAYFTFSGFAFAALGDARAGMDIFDLCRNTSAQTETFYVVQSKANPGAGVLVAFTDNNPDEDIINNEQTDLLINPTYTTPLPPPCARSFIHGTRRLWLYGHINMGRHTSHGNTGTLLIGESSVTTTSGFNYRGREGQRFDFIADPAKVGYRVVEVTDVNVVYLNRNAPATISLVWEITDDIDGRNIYMMEPNQPWSHDEANVFTVGADLSDDVKGVFSIEDRTFVLTRRNLWALSGDLSEDPITTIRIDHVASVGSVGHWAWCETPYGVVFVDENMGVMSYNGSGLPIPLGSETPTDDFRPKTQFAAFDRGLLSETYCEWDTDNKRVLVSYCPVGVAAMTEQLAFDAVAGTWRGPWRRPMYKAGKLRNQTGKDVFVLGDLVGTLALEGDIPTDMVTLTSGTVLTVDGPVLITETGGGTFTTSMVGAPILFNDGAGNFYLNWIARRVSATQIQLLLVPATTIVAGWTYQVGVIHWQAKTAFLDLGDPGQPKVLRKLEVGYNRVSAGVDNLRVDGTSEGIAIVEAVDPTAVTGGLIKSSVDTNLGGTAFTLRFSGRTQYGNPQITKVRADISMCGGEEVPTVGDQKSVVVTPTVTP